MMPFRAPKEWPNEFSCRKKYGETWLSDARQAIADGRINEAKALYRSLGWGRMAVFLENRETGFTLD